MAKINISVDTEEKVVEVTIDGKPLENFTNAYVCSYPVNDYRTVPGFDCSLYTVDKGEDGLTRQTCLTAYGSTKAAEIEKEGKAVASKKHKGFIEAAVECRDGLSKYLGNQINKFRS